MMEEENEFQVGDIITNGHTWGKLVFIGRGIFVIRLVDAAGYEMAGNDRFLVEAPERLGWRKVCQHPEWVLMPSGAGADLNAVHGAHWCPFCGEKVR